MAHPLYALFHPQTIAVIGASDRYGSMGRNVFSQLLAHRCAPTIIPINNNHKIVGGQKSFSSLTDAATEHQIDTVIVVLSPDKLGSIIREANKSSIKNIILINNINTPNNSTRSKLDRASEQASKMAIQLFAVPSANLYQLFQQPEKSACAYIGQSVGIADCMQSYAQDRGIYFSRFVTLNPQNYPVSTGQLIDFIASDPHTSALLIHINVLDNPRELISALVAAARHKPVLVLSTLPDADDQDTLFAQALKRTHILTAHSLTQFFTAAKLIHTGIVSRGKNIALISNTPQICALTLKSIQNTDLQLAEPSNQTARALNKILGHKLLTLNPCDVPSNSVASIFQASCEQLLNDENTDAVCLIYAGQNTSDDIQTAQMVAQLQCHSHKPLLLIWLGSADNEQTRYIFNQNKNLHFKQPEQALHALAQLNLYRQNQQQRHRTGAFHDYHYAATTAKELHKHLRPLIPVAVLPASKNNTSLFLKGLKLHTPPNHHGKNPHGSLTILWEKQAFFGYVLTLSLHNRQIKLLPPITPEIAAHTLNQLGLPVAIWQDWLLNCIDILLRLTEIHTTQLTLHHDPDKGITCTDVKLNLQESINPIEPSNIFAPLPYDAELEINLDKKTTARLRPVRPEDAVLIQKLTTQMSEASRYTRFMSKSPTISPALLARFAHPDYQREFAVILHDDQQNPLAHASYTADPDMQSCEFGISIVDELQGKGMGTTLMELLIARAMAQGFPSIRAEILSDNHAMQKLALKLGFTLTKHPQDSALVEARLMLQ